MEQDEENDSKCGTITVQVYKDDTGKYFFDIDTDSEEVLPVSYVIEDTLYLYQLDIITSIKHYGKFTIMKNLAFY